MIKRIMIADEEAGIWEKISELLRDAGYKVLIAVDGEDALAKAQIEPCDLYLVDLCAPNMGGLELIEKIRFSQPLAVIIVISGFACIDTAIKAIRMGVFHYITKPFKAEELIGAVEAGLRVASGLKECTEEPAVDSCSRIPLMKGFSQEQQQDFMQLGTIERYNFGESIPLKRDNGALIWLEKGRMNVMYKGAVVDILSEGEIWGEEGFVFPNALFTQLVAQSEIQVRRFKRHRIIEFFAYHGSELTNRYVINIFQSVYQKWRRSMHKIGIYSGYNQG